MSYRLGIPHVRVLSAQTLSAWELVPSVLRLPDIAPRDPFHSGLEGPTVFPQLRLILEVSADLSMCQEVEDEWLSIIRGNPYDRKVRVATRLTC